MKSVLCYGDSNTWGYDAATRDRFAPHVRWTGVLQARLGLDYRVIEEGLNGRTTRWEDPIDPGRNGATYLIPCLLTHRPLDLVIIMLGTNDLKARFNLSASDIAESAASLGAEARRQASNAAGEPAPVLLVAPPATVELGEFDQLFAGAREKSRQFSHYYRLAARWYGLPFFDAGEVIVSSDLDGIHLDAPEHAKLGESLATVVKSMIG